MRLAVLLFVLSVVLGTGSVRAQAAAPFCPVGQAPEFVLGFAQLKARLGPIMGEPIECEHANPENGDALQQTTTGLSFYRKSTNAPTFTDGHRHWGLTGAGLVYWEGASVDPPATVVAGLPASERQDWQVYINTRFAFSVRAPPDWRLGEEAHNGDGARLHTGNPRVTVSAYGRTRAPGLDPYETLQHGANRIQPITLDSGTDAVILAGTTGRGLSTIVRDLVLLTDTTEYHVYAEIDESIFSAFEESLLLVMKSLRVLPRSPL